MTVAGVGTTAVAAAVPLLLRVILDDAVQVPGHCPAAHYDMRMWTTSAPHCL